MLERPVENVPFSSSAPRGNCRIRAFVSEICATSPGRDRYRDPGAHPFGVRVFVRGREQVFEGVHPGFGGSVVHFRFEP